MEKGEKYTHWNPLFPLSPLHGVGVGILSYKSFFSGSLAAYNDTSESVISADT
jgi:hypothetical protein